MTRASRTLLVMGLLSVGGVASLAWMAQRYSSALEGRTARARAVPGAARGVLPRDDDAAERLVEAYVAVRGALEAPRTDERSTREVLDAALETERLTLEQYRELDLLVRAWREGAADLPPSYRAALDRRRERIGLAGD